MAFKLQKSSIERAIAHLARFGDTDVFPHLPEIRFLSDKKEEVSSELAQLDLDSFAPETALEALAPKSRYGFRITHQMSATDTVLFLASTIEIGPQIEALRTAPAENSDFSYRFQDGPSEEIFQKSHTYKDWLKFQQQYVKNSLKIKTIVHTDISDFYARVNFHRLENLLDQAAVSHGAVRFIKKTIKTIRARQSFGLPVGGTAARILAELALVDTDIALRDAGIISSRFVDDFRIFLDASQNPYDVLSVLAQQLGINEGLALNSSKTKVVSRTEFLKEISYQTTDISEEATGQALEALTSEIYFDDDPDIEDIEALKAMNLLGFLQNEIGGEDFDVGRVKVLFRALKIAAPIEAVEFVIKNFSELVVFSKEVVLLMEALDAEFPKAFSQMSEIVIDSILQPPASSVQLIRTWLLELFARGIVTISPVQLIKLNTLPTVLDKRQLHAIKSKVGQSNFFRQHKASLAQMSRFEQSAFIIGAACLPKDEYTNWLATIKHAYMGPTNELFLKWVRENQVALVQV